MSEHSQSAGTRPTVLTRRSRTFYQSSLHHHVPFRFVLHRSSLPAAPHSHLFVHFQKKDPFLPDSEENTLSVVTLRERNVASVRENAPFISTSDWKLSRYTLQLVNCARQFAPRKPSPSRARLVLTVQDEQPNTVRIIPMTHGRLQLILPSPAFSRPL